MICREEPIAFKSGRGEPHRQEIEQQHERERHGDREHAPRIVGVGDEEDDERDAVRGTTPGTPAAPSRWRARRRLVRSGGFKATRAGAYRPVTMPKSDPEQDRRRGEEQRGADTSHRASSAVPSVAAMTSANHREDGRAKGERWHSLASAPRVTFVKGANSLIGRASRRSR